MPFELLPERMGPLPRVNHFLDRLSLDAILADFVPSQDRDTGLPYAKALGVLLRSIIVEREPIYRQQETVESFAPGALGVDAEQAACLSDDRIGRALDRLFDAELARRGRVFPQVDPDQRASMGTGLGPTSERSGGHWPDKTGPFGPCKRRQVLVNSMK